MSDAAENEMNQSELQKKQQQRKDDECGGSGVGRSFMFMGVKGR